jgi:hypothetical protein
MIDIPRFDIKDFENDKRLSSTQLDKEMEKLIKYTGVNGNKNSFVGNNILYHFQLVNLMKCKRGKFPSFYDIITKNENLELYKKHYADTIKRKRTGTITNRLYEAWRINKGAIVFFKSCQAIYIYKKYKATSIVDFTAGWGGRLLGAWALGIDYVGIDTNINMKPAYHGMIESLKAYDIKIGRKSPKMKMIWESCLDVDFSTINYDLVLTSPPYVNMEEYEHMKLWKTTTDFNESFMNPIFINVYDNIRADGHVCINISPNMWQSLKDYTNVYPQLTESINLKQQLGQNQVKKTTNIDMVYIWVISAKVK